MRNSVNMLSYMTLRGDISFMQSPFNEVDAMILTQLSSIDYSDCMPDAAHAEQLVVRKWQARPSVGEVADNYRKKKEAQKKDTQDKVPAFTEKENLLFLVGKSKRFEKVRMDGFVRDSDVEKEKKFSAVTFYLDPFWAHIAYRGTDGSFISWKENFNMTYEMPVPAQTDAVRYLETVAAQKMVKCSVGGHSKGGNIALYAAAFSKAEVQKKIKAIYCFDAPGYLRDISQDASFQNIAACIRAYVPESAVIGTVMNTPFTPEVVRSDEVGIRQHSMLTWQVEATQMEHCERRDDFSLRMETIVNGWIDRIPQEQKPQAVNDVFEIFRRNKITEFSQLYHMDWRQVVGVIKGATLLPAQTRDLFVSMIKTMWEEGRKKTAKE